jgi:hypothetical protein
VSDGAGENGQGSNPRFTPGGPGGPGNPNAKHARKWSELLKSTTTEEDFLAVWKAVVDAARDGDMKAADLFLERLCGKVPQALEHSGPEGGAIHVLTKWGAPPAGGEGLGS